jgi:hypothetical protein
VRIDDAGKFQHVLGGRPVVKGEAMTDAVEFWLPCR